MGFPSEESMVVIRVILGQYKLRYSIILCIGGVTVIS